MLIRLVELMLGYDVARALDCRVSRMPKHDTLEALFSMPAIEEGDKNVRC